LYLYTSVIKFNLTDIHGLAVGVNLVEYTVFEL